MDECDYSKRRLLTQHIWESLQVTPGPFLNFWVGPGDEANWMLWLLIFACMGAQFITVSAHTMHSPWQIKQPWKFHGEQTCMCIYVQPAALNQSKPYADAGLNLPLLPHTHTHTHTHTQSCRWLTANSHPRSKTRSRVNEITEPLAHV